MKKMLENGNDETIRRVIEKIILALDTNDFAQSFAEYSAYRAAVNSKSVKSLRQFMEIFPDSSHVSEVKGCLDEQLFLYAQNLDSIEGYVDYLEQMPVGKHRQQVLQCLEPLLSKELRHGNRYFRSTYQKYFHRSGSSQ